MRASSKNELCRSGMAGQSFFRTWFVPTYSVVRSLLLGRGYRRSRSRGRHMWTATCEPNQILAPVAVAPSGPAGDNAGENGRAGDNPEGGPPPPAALARHPSGPPGRFLSWTTSHHIHRHRRLIHSYEALIHRPGGSVHRREDEVSSRNVAAPWRSSSRAEVFGSAEVGLPAAVESAPRAG